MNEVEFRAWYPKAKLMSLPFTPLANSTYTVTFVDPDAQDDSALVFMPDEWIFMQYINVEDSEGHRIFAGDIVQHIERPEFTGVVRFVKGGFFAVGKNATDPRHEVWSGTFMERKCVVIGNAYQNPELMDWFKPPIVDPAKPKKRSEIAREIVKKSRKKKS